MISMNDALQVIEKRRGDAIIVPTMTGWLGWTEVSGNPALDCHDGGAMGKASSVALGIALAQPGRKVLVIDGDGSMLMNLGTLVTVAGKSPENLYHFMLDNGMYAVTGGQPTPNAGGYSFPELAKTAGYAATFEFDDLEELATGIDEVFSARGPVFVNIKTVPDTDTDAIVERLGDRLRPMRDSISAVMQSLRQ